MTDRMEISPEDVGSLDDVLHPMTDRREEPATDLVFDRPTDYRCSFEGCGYIMIDAAAGDIEDHYGDHFEREALPAPLDVERLYQAMKGIGVIESGAWVSFEREDAELIADRYDHLPVVEEQVRMLQEGVPNIHRRLSNQPSTEPAKGEER